ncbi:MAG TPA: hypothetical protein PKD86_07975 [Gemmatales bacterium]|nr:hypothetical protein [Gemmatales bacterium]HMP59276.1 hypothetical protein [Gemmatales bacterium]
MPSANDLGGVIHVYQKYDPVHLPGPRAEPPDLLTPAFEHLLEYGDLDELTPEQLAQAVRIDPSEIKGLGPSLDSIAARLRERRRKILQTYETDSVQHQAAQAYQEQVRQAQPPGKLARRFNQAARDEQLRELELLYYQAGDDRSDFARRLVQIIDRLADKYQVEELAARYDFTGRSPLTVPEALAVKEELELIDKLLRQIEEAKKTAQVALIDLEELNQYLEPGQLDELRALQQQIEDYLREAADRQGLERSARGYQITPKALRLFQSRVLTTIFSELQAARSGRHVGPILGDGAVEMTKTRPYEFGDSVAHMDIPSSLINAMLHESEYADQGKPGRLRLRPEDIVIHQTRNNPKCATAVLLDMSGSMRYGGLYVNVKRMGLALDGLIRKDFPGDYLQFIEMFTFAKPRAASELIKLMPKPVTIFSPVVRLRADLSNPEISEYDIPPHFTNIQHALRLGRQCLAAQDTPNRQMILITDGLPTAHFDGKELYMLYPPDRRTEEATLREAHLCAREGIVINIFLLSNWNQSEEDVHFARRLAESTKGRVFFVAGRELDRFVLWDYLTRRRQIIG